MTKPSPPPPQPLQLHPVELKLYPSRSPAFTDTVPLPPPANPPTWAHIQKVICSGNLDDLYRDPACESAYRAWSGPVKKEWGSLERFIRVVRLEWDDPVLAAAANQQNGASATPAQNGVTSNDSSGSSSVKNGFFEDLEDEWKVKMIPNHWPYNMPPGCKHWCVWSRRPITHISQLPVSTSPTATAFSSSSSSTSPHSTANGRVAPASPPTPSDTDGFAATSAARADSSQLSPTAPVPWPFPHMTRAEQEQLYAAVSRDGIRALIPPGSFTERGLTPAPVTGEYVLDFFRSNPQLAAPDQILLSNNNNDSQSGALDTMVGGEQVVAEAPLEARAIQAANATMAYFSQHCVQCVLRMFPPEQGWDCILFCNPPHLRTVPGLDHWHIMSLDPAVAAQLQAQEAA
ncbi:hypothetical protein OC846_006784 [Tilletia horrida]|uniref:Uncharacterized protein n=1 Tax=Tilletia horrida TaxID=155126 RepID=A0AAN6JP18_9BASI|nr:hypothetical protein OC846_006784 [Tilletia horrida]KAK0551379.1 hypothetical protein OC845_002186 [Tilletia horrida]KAK0558570.1 hypothetical protein OC861_006879 [Tilletia horrida]